MQRNYTITRIRRAFELYKDLSASQMSARHYRGNLGGIAVADDEYAIKWQRLELRMHIIDQWIRGDTINWFFARHLTVEEAAKRNKEGELSQ